MFLKPKNMPKLTAKQVKEGREALSSMLGVDLNTMPQGSAIELSNDQVRSLMGEQVSYYLRSFGLYYVKGTGQGPYDPVVFSNSPRKATRFANVAVAQSMAALLKLLPEGTEIVPV